LPRNGDGPGTFQGETFNKGERAEKEEWKRRHEGRVLPLEKAGTIRGKRVPAFPRGGQLKN